MSDSETSSDEDLQGPQDKWIPYFTSYGQLHAKRRVPDSDEDDTVPWPHDLGDSYSEDIDYSEGSEEVEIEEEIVSDIEEEEDLVEENEPQQVIEQPKDLPDEDIPEPEPITITEPEEVNETEEERKTYPQPYFKEEFEVNGIPENSDPEKGPLTVDLIPGVPPTTTGDVYDKWRYEEGWKYLGKGVLNYVTEHQVFRDLRNGQFYPGAWDGIDIVGPGQGFANERQWGPESYKRYDEIKQAYGDPRALELDKKGKLVRQTWDLSPDETSFVKGKTKQVAHKKKHVRFVL